MSDLYKPGQFSLSNGEWMLGPDNLNIVGAFGNTVPSDAATGFYTGCVFMHLDGGAATSLYVNEGTTASADFNALQVAGSAISTTAITFPTAGTVTIPANTAAALGVTDATTTILAFDTRNTLKNINSVGLTGVAVTVATEAAVHQNATVNIAAKTITYTGTATVTSSLGAQLYVNAPTFTDAGAGTITTVSSVHIAAVAAAGGSLTITNSRMISTGVSDCYLTNAGVWTDTACWAAGKKQIGRSAKKVKKQVEAVLEKIKPATWKYKKTMEGTAINDRDRNRVGIVYDDLPDELRAPGEERGVASSILASFGLAAIKTIWDENRVLKDRLAALEAKLA